MWITHTHTTHATTTKTTNKNKNKKQNPVSAIYVCKECTTIPGHMYVYVEYVYNATSSVVVGVGSAAVHTAVPTSMISCSHQVFVAVTPV